MEAVTPQVGYFILAFFPVFGVPMLVFCAVWIIGIFVNGFRDD